MKALLKRHRIQSEDDEKDGSTYARHKKKSPAGMLVAVLWLLAEMGENGREVYEGSVQ